MEELLSADISWETGDVREARDNGCLVVQGPGRVGAEDLACSIHIFLLLLFAFDFRRSVKDSWGRLECSGKVIQFCFGPVNRAAVFWKESLLDQIVEKG